MLEPVKNPATVKPVTDRPVRKTRNWSEDNRAAIDEYNAYIEEHGLVLARYRRF